MKLEKPKIAFFYVFNCMLAILLKGSGSGSGSEFHKECRMERNVVPNTH